MCYLLEIAPPQGKVKDEMDQIRREVIKCLALVEALIDFGEGEDIEEGTYDQGTPIFYSQS